jgi:hypothetical protein
MFKCFMETLSIDIMNPVAKKIIYELAELKLIVINESPDPQTEFKMLLEKLRSQKDTVPSMKEIQREVDNVRAKRYARRMI